MHAPIWLRACVCVGWLRTGGGLNRMLVNDGVCKHAHGSSDPNGELHVNRCDAWYIRHQYDSMQAYAYVHCMLASNGVQSRVCMGGHSFACYTQCVCMQRAFYVPALQPILYRRRTPTSGPFRERSQTPLQLSLPACASIFKMNSHSPSPPCLRCQSSHHETNIRLTSYVLRLIHASLQ